MTVFISYSHRDHAFVDRLSLELLNHNIKLWRDEYQMSAGDSLTDRIRDAIDRASFLCVAVSESSVASEWVRREIEAGLLRTSAEVGLTIIPLLLEECELPEQLQDHIAIDFRESFDEGFAELLGVVKRRYEVDDSTGTTETDKYFFYYGTEEGWVHGCYDLEIDVVSLDREEQFCILTTIRIRGNEAATEAGFRERNIDSASSHILRACAQEFIARPARVKISVKKPAAGSFSIESDGGLRFDAHMRIRMLGTHRGETVVFNFGALFEQICANAGLDVAEQ